MSRASSLLVLTLLFLAGLIVWGALSDRPSLGWDRGGEAGFRIDGLGEAREGSLVPCDVPLRWRVPVPDPRFGLESVEVAQLVDDAAGIWEGSVGRTLFEHDPVEGFPIRLVFDDRQQRSQQRRQLQDEIDNRSARLETLHRQLDDRRQRLERDREEHQRLVEAFTERAAEHNRRVARWNEEGGGSALEDRRLRRAEEELESERRRLDEMARELNRRQEELGSAADRFNREVDDFNRMVGRAGEEVGPEEVESGVYREEVEETNGRITRLSREIRIYQFVDPNHLTLILAHELGHALGLPHVDEPDAIMAYTPDATHLEGRPLRPALADLRILRERCPDL